MSSWIHELHAHEFPHHAARRGCHENADGFEQGVAATLGTETDFFVSKAVRINQNAKGQKTRQRRMMAFAFRSKR
jgi:hypothetical protein